MADPLSKFDRPPLKDLIERLAEKGVQVDRTTLERWQLNLPLHEHLASLPGAHPEYRAVIRSLRGFAGILEKESI